MKLLMHTEWRRDDYTLTDDKARLDLDAVCALLNATYWAAARPREVIAKSIEHSICFGLLHGGRQAGFARAVTDYATFAWICDVVIAPEHRGRGLGKWIVECVLAHPELQTGGSLTQVHGYPNHEHEPVVPTRVSRAHPRPLSTRGPCVQVPHLR